jgi:site-specific recombinase XerD
MIFVIHSQPILGHSNIANTQTYLHPSDALLWVAGERWEKHARRRGPCL